MKALTVSGREEGQRFDKYLKKYLPEAPGSFIYKMLRKKNITLNGKKADGSEKIRSGDEVKLFLSDETITGFQSVKKSAGASKQRFGNTKSEPAASKRRIASASAKIEVLYEDEHLLIVNKPANLLTQGDKSGEISLADLIDAGSCVEPGFGTGSEIDSGSFRVSPANRLDRNTSGIVLCGKSIRGMQFLSELIRSRDVKKEYLVLTSGRCDIHGVEKVWYIKDASSNRVHLSATEREGYGIMMTGITPVAVTDKNSLLRIDLLTGRPHQIRAHLAYLGYPVLGDPKYGNAEVNREMKRRHGVSRQMLHSCTVTFPESIEDPEFAAFAGKVIEAPLPEDFARAVKELGL